MNDSRLRRITCQAGPRHRLIVNKRLVRDRSQTKNGCTHAFTTASQVLISPAPSRQFDRPAMHLLRTQKTGIQATGTDWHSQQPSALRAAALINITQVTSIDSSIRATALEMDTQKGHFSDSGRRTCPTIGFAAI